MSVEAVVRTVSKLTITLSPDTPLKTPRVVRAENDRGRVLGYFLAYRRKSGLIKLIRISPSGDIKRRYVSRVIFVTPVSPRDYRPVPIEDEGVFSTMHLKSWTFREGAWTLMYTLHRNILVPLGGKYIRRDFLLELGVLEGVVRGRPFGRPPIPEWLPYAYLVEAGLKDHHVVESACYRETVVALWKTDDPLVRIALDLDVVQPLLVAYTSVYDAPIRELAKVALLNSHIPVREEPEINEPRVVVREIDPLCMLFSLGLLESPKSKEKNLDLLKYESPEVILKKASERSSIARRLLEVT